MLFVCGAVCMATKRQCAGRADGDRVGAERGEYQFHRLRQPVPANRPELSIGLDGQLIALFVIVLAAAEAAVALAITLNFYNNHATIDIDQADELRDSNLRTRCI